MPTRKDLVVLVDQSLIDGLLQGLHQECCRLGRLATAHNPRRALPNITVSSYAARLDRHKAETVQSRRLQSDLTVVTFSRLSVTERRN